MGWHYHFKFFRKIEKIEKKFIQNLIENLQLSGCVYYEPEEYYKSAYWSNEKDDLVWGRPLEEAIEVTSNQMGGCLKMWYGNEIDFSVHIHPNKLGMLEVTLLVDRVYLSSTTIEEDIKNSNILLNISEKLYDFLHPFYAYADQENERPEDKELISRDIKHIYWVNFFPPELVEKIGKEKILSAPSWKTEELRDGGILLILGPTPYDLKIEREEVEKYLGFR